MHVRVYLCAVCVYRCPGSLSLTAADPPAAAEPLWPPWKVHLSSAAVHSQGVVIEIKGEKKKTISKTTIA